MNNLGTDYASILSQQARMKDMLAKAEQERQANELLKSVETRVRRVLRINNDSAR